MRRRLLVALATLALPLSMVLGAAPAAADAPRLTLVHADDSGSQRLCVGIPDPDGANATWVCTPEAQWYAQVIAMAFAMNPA